MASVWKDKNERMLTAWKMYAEYSDGTELYFLGNSEEDCIQEIADRQEEYGNCLFYTGIDDEDYIGGEYVGRENFVY